MQNALKQSTAVVIEFGPFVDKTDGVTLETGLVSALDHASTGILLSKNGGTLTIRHATVTASSYDAHGCYKVTLDTTDTGTLGSLRVIYTDAATCLPVWRDFTVLPAMIYDSLVAGSDRFDTNVTHIADTAQTAKDVGAALPAAAPNANGGLPILSSSGTTLGYTISTLTTYTGNTPQTGDSYAIVNSGTHGNAALKGYVDDIGTAGAGLTAIPWNAAWDAEVQSEVDDAMQALGYTATVSGRIDAAITSRMATFTLPTNFSAFSIDSNGIAKSNVTKFGNSDVNTSTPVDGDGYPYVNTLVFGTTASTIIDDIAARQYVQYGSAASATSSTVVGPAEFSSVNDAYKNCLIWIVSGTGADQAPRLCTGYTGSSRTFAITPNWTTTPATNDKILVLPAGILSADVKSISGDTTAADNAKTVFSTDFAANYSTDDDGWVVYAKKYYDSNAGDFASFPDDFSTLVVSGGGVTAALSSTERNAIADALLDRTNGIESGTTLRQAMRGTFAFAVGAITGGGTGTEVLKGGGVATTRATYTVDGDGNRTIVLNL